MFKFLLILSLGIAVGYSYGWKDAQVHTMNIAERMVDRIGGANKDKQRESVDLDAKMRAAESR